MAIEPIGSNPFSNDPSVKNNLSIPPDQSFIETLKETILQVNQIQTEADQSVSRLVSGQEQDLHQTLIALEKASVSFQLMMQVRNKIVNAYEEIFRMQV